MKTTTEKIESTTVFSKGHKIIDAEKLNDFLKTMIADSFSRNFIAYKIAEHENEILR